MPAYFRSTLEEFLGTSDTTIIGFLSVASGNAGFPLEPAQLEAWKGQLPALRESVLKVIDTEATASAWSLLLEYPIPRIGKRIDAVILANGVVLVLEFKIGTGSASAIPQVEDYALSLACFHEESRGVPVVPIAVTSGPRAEITSTDNLIASTFRTPISQLTSTLLEAVQRFSNPAHTIAAASWDESRFRPIPSIIDAAIALYADMDVFEIGHACSAQETLELATSAIKRAFGRAKSNRKRIVCFLTGVPGSGKTLVGLNAVHETEWKSESSFFSGNGPLVKVLRQALVEDDVKRTGKTAKKAAVAVQTFIHNVHHFAAEYFADEKKVPTVRVVVFDEAQRAWDRKRNMQKFGRPVSEPEMILEILERLDWCVLVALVGGGQEINSGEAGLEEWGRALSQRSDRWEVAAAPDVIVGTPATAGHILFADNDGTKIQIECEPDLHLNVSVRSLRSERMADWVNVCLEGNSIRAAEIASSSAWEPVLVTRSLQNMKDWLRSMERGHTRAGIVGSAYAVRMRADGLEYSQGFHATYKWEKWFLAARNDVRSSSALEVPATQFEIQGLELDWVGLCWGDDLVWDGKHWRICRIKYPKSGTTWKVVPSRSKKGENPRIKYSINGYRVLMTRARRQLIIYIPNPSEADRSRQHEFLDATADFLIKCGAKVLEKKQLRLPSSSSAAAGLD